MRLPANVRTALIAAVTAVLAVVAYSQVSGYLERREAAREERDAIKTSVSELTATVKATLELETTESSMTFAELFDQNEETLKKLTAAAIPIETSSLKDGEKKALKLYVGGLQELVRLHTAKYRKALAASSAAESFADARRDLEGANYYSYDYLRPRADQALAEAREANSEAETASNAFIAKVKSFRTALNKLRPELKRYSLLEDATIAAVVGDEAPPPKATAKSKG
ncbi:hypothetical protein [Caulobacter sp. 17J65-9]|uniref:hypothetical protein n=1 Tax=Caulobacter sp. 17J65-9 TaxID=2709382 RepID=UPI0013C83EA1|nr:hypothetical protein [Caulobacter sp. 17J65-9]NEX94054.1 hypothetical protein [Caulobacter sp. 17J65-9]